MIRLRRTAGLPRIFVLAVAAGMAICAAPEFGRAAEPEFPFGQVLLLDAAPLRPAKRKPSLTVAPDGSAAIDLWCKSVEARVKLSDAAITITPAALPDELPGMMANGQCTAERMLADESLRDALSQVGAWRRQGSAVIFTGPATMRFYLSTN